MDRILKTFLFALSLCALSSFSFTSAQGAIFDTMESVDQLKVIAAQNASKADRMPAGKESTPAGDDESTPAKSPASTEKEIESQSN